LAARRAARTRLRTWLHPRRALALPHQGEVVVGDRILVSLAQVLLVDEHVEVRRQRARLPALEKLDCPRVLLAAKDELRFLLSPRHLLPHGHGRRHQNRDDAQPDEECHHGVAAVGAAPLQALAAGSSTAIRVATLDLTS
jgi:hypothetical protein